MTPAQRIAKVLCKGFPDHVCDTHIEETLLVLLLIPELLTDVEVIKAVARVSHPDLDSKHQADQVVALSKVMAYLQAAGSEISKETTREPPGWRN